MEMACNYQKNTFLAVKSEKGGFYLCKTLEYIPARRRRNKRYKIKWLEEVSNNSYLLSYDDTIDSDCIITSVILVNRRSSILKLGECEKKRIEKLANSSEISVVEDIWCNDDEDEINLHKKEMVVQTEEQKITKEEKPMNESYGKVKVDNAVIMIEEAGLNSKGKSIDNDEGKNELKEESNSIEVSDGVGVDNINHCSGPMNTKENYRAVHHKKEINDQAMDICEKVEDAIPVVEEEELLNNEDININNDEGKNELKEESNSIEVSDGVGVDNINLCSGPMNTKENYRAVHHKKEINDQAMDICEKVEDAIPVVEEEELLNNEDININNDEGKNELNEEANSIEVNEVVSEDNSSRDSDFEPDLDDESSSVASFSSVNSEMDSPKSPSKTSKIRRPKFEKNKQSSPNKICIPSSKSVGRKTYDQFHSCFYCDKLVQKMSKHLERCHDKEMDVAKILSMPLNSKARRDAFIEFTRVGDYHYNCEVLSKKKGDLILLRRPSPVEKEGKTYTDYLPCPHCLGFLLRPHLWSHIKYNCHVAKTCDSHKSNEKRNDFLGLSRALLGHTLSTKMSGSFYENIILTLKKKDGVKEICTEDPLIIKLGMLLFEKFNVTKNDLIRQNMRRLGRLVLEFRNIKSKFSEATLIDCMQPQNFDFLIQAVKNISITELNPSERPKMKIPSLALKLGHTLRKCASLQRGICLKEGDLKNERNMKSFLSLMEIEWENRISSTALSTFRRAKLTKEDLLPVTSDLLKLNSHLDKNIESYIGLLKDDPSNGVLWRKLSRSTLSRIMIFNKKRSGEVSKMKIQDYVNRRDWEGENSEEIKKTMSDLEKRLMETMTLVYIVGKRERNVPVLLTADMKKAIDFLLENRKNISMITSVNDYMFPAFSSKEPERGHDVLRDICKEVDLVNPMAITSTKMRKYIATVTQVVNLSDNESDWLARHLGHNIRVHREFYRLQESAVELTKVSRLLLAVDKGEISQFSGRKLEDINIEDLPMLSEDEEDNEEICEKVNEDHKSKTRSQKYLPVLSEDEEDDEEIHPKVHEILKSKHRSQKCNKTMKKQIETSKKSSCKKRKVWSQHEKQILFDHFKHNIKKAEIPGKLKCEEFIQLNGNNPFFSSLKWRDIKYGVYNRIQTIKPKNRN